MINLNEKNVSCFKKTYAPFSTDKKAVTYNDLRICYIQKGAAVWQIENQAHTVGEGDIIFLNNRQKRYFSQFDENGFEICVMVIKRQAFLNTCHLAFFLSLAKENRGIIKNGALLRLLKEAVEEYEGKQRSCYELMSARLTEFFIRAERMFGFDPERAVKMDQNMIKILDYVDLNLTKNITLKEAAKLASLTESSFSRWFAQCNGIGFKKYVMAKKVEYAISLLESSGLNVIDAAYECGFSSISGFYDAFRKVTGTTPRKISGTLVLYGTADRPARSKTP